MKLSALITAACAALMISLAAGPAGAVDPDAVIRLKAAGVGDIVLETLVREKSLETAAFTVDEIVRMKAAGVGDDALVEMIEARSFVAGKKEVVYGQDVRPVTRATVSDILKLKEAGISAEVINTLIENQVVDTGVEEQRRALEILKGMNLMIDTR
jgi:hypothetical protein